MSLPNTTEEHRPEPDPDPGPRKLPIALATVGALVLGTALGWGVRAPESTEAYRELSEEHAVTGTELAETREAEAAQQETIDDLRDELTALAEPLEELDEREEGLDGREEELDQWEGELTDLEEELDEREAEVTTLETEVEENSIPGTGTFLVNEEVSPGTYRSDDLSSCYWARLSATDGSLDAIIANNFGGGRQVVTINGSDVAFETDGCGNWTKI